MCENRDFVAPVNILTPFVCVQFSLATQHTTVWLDQSTQHCTKFIRTYILVKSMMTVFSITLIE